MIKYAILVRVTVNVIRHSKLINIWRLKTSGKVLFDKLALECEDEILNTTETLHDNKAAICGSNCHFQTISLVIICTLLLASVSIGCYYSYRNKNIY